MPLGQKAKLCSLPSLTSPTLSQPILTPLIFSPPGLPLALSDSLHSPGLSLPLSVFLFASVARPLSKVW